MVGCTAASHDMATVKSHSWMHIATKTMSSAWAQNHSGKPCAKRIYGGQITQMMLCFILCFVVFTVLLTHLRSRCRANSHLNVAIHRSYLVARGAALHLWQQLFTVYCTQSSPRDSVCSLFRKLIIMFWLGFAATKQTDTHVKQWGYVSGSRTTTRLGYKVL